MGIDINAIVNASLKLLATEIDEKNVKDGTLDDNEISIFTKEAEDIIKKGEATAYDVQAVLGLNLSNNTSVTTPVELSNKSTKRNQNAVKGMVKDLVKAGVHPNDLVATLRTKFSNPEYAQMINDVETILGLVNATNYNSKNDVDNIHKTVKKQLKEQGMWKDYHQDILKLLEKQAEKTQISKEYDVLRDRYIDIKNKMANTGIVKEKGDNFKAYVEILKDELQKDKTWEKSYTKKAFDYVEKYAQQNAMAVAQERLDKETKGADNKAIKNEMEKLNKSDDKYQEKAIEELKPDRKIFGRKHTYEENLKELKNVSREKLEKELDKNTFEKLNRSYLGKVKNADGTYDLTQLAEEILSRAGADYTVSRNDDDPEMAELTHVGRHLKSITGQEFKKSELKDLIKLSGIKYEHKDRSAKTIAREAFDLPSVAAAATSGAILAPYVKQVQGGVLEFADKNITENIIKQLAEQGIKVDRLSDMSIKFNQKQLVNLKPLGPLAGILIEAAVKGLWTLAFGVDKNEKSCMSVSDYDINDPKYTVAENYKKYISETYNNPQKVDAIHSLVDTYVQAYGKDWHTHFQQGIRGIAGIGSKLNPDECRMMQYSGAKVDIPAPKPTEEKPPVTQPVVVEHEEEPECPECEVVTRQNIKLDGTNGNPNSAKYYWEELINMYYSNCLKENGGTHTMKEIRFQLRKVNNIPNNYPSVPKGIVLPFDLFGDGSCERTIKQDVTLRQRTESGNNKVRVLQMQDGSYNFGISCPRADGTYGEVSWDKTPYATKEAAERAGKELISK